MEQANVESMLEHVDNGNSNWSWHLPVIYNKSDRLTTDCKTAHLLIDLKAIATWDIVVFCDTRTKPQEIVVDDNHKLFLARESYITAGIGILIHERHAEATSNFTQ